MRINTLYVEHAARGYRSTEEIIGRLEPQMVIDIEDHQDLFSRKKTPYLSKRTERNMFLAVKKGQLVRETPPAYGYSESDLHFYHIHAYNCIYECEYCYLQGYFSSPDLVFFVNRDDIMQSMQQIVDSHPHQSIWFHAGEFSDSLALSHVTGELADYWSFFAANSRARLELRTKSINLKELRKLPPLENTIVSFSLSAESQASAFDHETPSISQRLEAMKRLKELGFRLAIHLDPIIWAENFTEEFDSLAQSLSGTVGFGCIDYVSLGVVRFAKNVFKDLKTNYPDSQILARQFVHGADSKMRYPRPFRLGILEMSREILKKHGCPEEKIYFCME